MNRDELIILVKKIMHGEGNEEEISEMILILQRNVPHPAPSDLIFYDDLTPEEVVDRALAYKPLIL